MTFIAESKVSSAACARYYAAGDNITITAGYIIKPQSSTTWGSSGNWSYNSSTGLFSLSSSHIYLVEADLYSGRLQPGPPERGSVTSMITDGAGTEITDSCRGMGIFLSCERYYEHGQTVADQTTFAIIDGSSISSFYWKVQAIDLESSGTIKMNHTSGTGGTTYGRSDSRLIIREYPA